MASHFSRRRFAASPALNVVGLERSALPGSVVDAVLRFHDEAQDRRRGLHTLAHKPQATAGIGEVKAVLGKKLASRRQCRDRWNEDESQIIRVLEAA